jgi:hypothetical protein
MWVCVEPKENGEEPTVFATRRVLRRAGWYSMIFCDNRFEAEELASAIRQEGFEVKVSEPLRMGRTSTNPLDY